MLSKLDPIPLAVPVVGAAEARNLQACIESTFVSSVGPFTTQFEAMVAAATGAPRGVATSAGTTGLHAALMTAGVGRDDLVIVPSFTFIASANAIAHCGAHPWFMDVDPATWLLDLGQVADELVRNTSRNGDGWLIHHPTGRRVAAMMPVYTLGTLLDFERQRELAQRFRFPVVADAAAALGARSRGRPLADGADLSVISFNGNKIVTSGGGGMVVGNDEDLLERVRHLTTTARTSADYTFDCVGYNYRITNLQAAVGCAQMERLAEFITAKRSVRRRYSEAFSDLSGVGSFPGLDDECSTCWLSGIVVWDSTRPQPANAAELLRQLGIEARTFWKPAHLQAPYAGSPRADLSVTEDLWARILTLPCSTSLTDAQQDRVIDAVRTVYI